MTRCRHDKRGPVIRYGDEEVCLRCAAALYEEGNARYMPAWLLVHGKELDRVHPLHRRAASLSAAMDALRANAVGW